MAAVVNQAIELYSILKVFREVSADEHLVATHKLWLAKDLRKSLPPRAMCGQCMDTYDIILSIMTTEVEALTNAAVPVPAPVPIVAEVEEVRHAAPKAKAAAKVKSRRAKKAGAKK